MRRTWRWACGLICAAFFLMAAGCTMEKEAITSDEFAAHMQELGFEIVDVTNQMDGQVESAVLALGEDAAYQLEFFEVSTEEQAESAYAQNKATFEMEKGSASTSFTGSGKNFHVYSQKSDGWFSYVCQVERTFLYARVPAEHQDTVEEAAKALGY